MAFYDANGRSNYFIEFGRGRPILLLHGIGNSGRAWGPQIPFLVEAGYRVVVPDHAGHGASAPVSRPFGVTDIADDTELLLAHLDIDTFDIVGLSLGGMIALELALRHPAKIRRLAVANSFDNTTAPAFRTMAEGWAAIFEKTHGPVERLEQNWPAVVSPSFRATAEGMRTYQIWHGVAATADGASLAQISRGITEFDVSRRIGELAMPALFLGGSHDVMSPPEVCRRMAEQALAGEFSIIDGAAHISNVDSAEEFTAHLLAFLQAHDEK
jgi:3-oxoadipate enol-lactonase